MRTGALSLVLLGGGLLLGLGCKSLKSGAQEEFSEHYSCPKSRVTVKETSGVSPFGAVGQSPPAEVASDPGRLAEWKKNQKKKAAAVAKMCDAFEAEGCGHKVTYCCSYPRQNGHAGRVMCKEVKP